MIYQFDDYEITTSREFEDGEAFYIAKIDELEAIGEGETREEAIEDLRFTFEDIIDISKEEGLRVAPPIKRKASGHLSLRIPKSLHGSLSSCAKKEGVSINQLITAALSRFIGQEESQKTYTTYITNNIASVIPYLGENYFDTALLENNLQSTENIMSNYFIGEWHVNQKQLQGA
jgi:predicted HicB family RNase H-like nuclease